MKPSIHNDHFVKFPYIKEIRDNGDINNGGIDLVKEPHRIDEIHELEGAPWLKLFISAINSPDSYFMSFGCVYGPIEDYFAGYIDFSLRPNAPIHLRQLLNRLDEDFYIYLEEDIQKKTGNPKEAIQYAKNYCSWEISPLEIYGQAYDKVGLNFQYHDQTGIAWIFEHLQYFLTNHYPSTHPRN